LTNGRIKNLVERVDNLKGPPQQDDFSSRRLASEMKEALESLIRTRGSGFLTDPYGRNYHSSILEAIRKAEVGNYLKANDYVNQLTPDEQLALAHLIHDYEHHENEEYREEAKTN
jgi:hypothetical protein